MDLVKSKVKSGNIIGAHSTINVEVTVMAPGYTHLLLACKCIVDSYYQGQMQSTATSIVMVQLYYTHIEQMMSIQYMYVREWSVALTENACFSSIVL